MVKPEQFVMSFLNARAEAYAAATAQLAPIYSRYFGRSLLKHSRSFMPRDKVNATIAEVKQVVGLTEVFVRERINDTDIGTRYRLSRVVDSWKIVDIS